LTEGFCPVCKKVFEAQNELERAEQNGDVKAAEELKAYVDKFRARKFAIYNAVNANGNVVKLELPFGVHKTVSTKLGECISKDNPRRYDPFHPDTGVWFEFKKSGKGFKTKYEVNFKSILVDVNGESLSKIDRSPLPLPPETVEQIKAQIVAGTKNEVLDGPLSDIHTLHEPMTAKELADLMNGILPGTKPVATPANTGDMKHELERLRNLQKQAEKTAA
jgi:hypothetical protein